MSFVCLFLHQLMWWGYNAYSWKCRDWLWTILLGKLLWHQWSGWIKLKLHDIWLYIMWLYESTTPWTQLYSGSCWLYEWTLYAWQWRMEEFLWKKDHSIAFLTLCLDISLRFEECKYTGSINYVFKVSDCLYTASCGGSLFYVGYMREECMEKGDIAFQQHDCYLTLLWLVTVLS